MNKIFSLAILMIGILTLAACQINSVKSLSDPYQRTPGTQLDDEYIVGAIEQRIESDQLLLNNSNVKAFAFNQKVVLAGEVLSPQDKAKIIDFAKSIRQVREIYADDIEVVKIIDRGFSFRDTWIKTQIVTRFLMASNIKYEQFEVAVFRAQIYLFGIADADQAQIAAREASLVANVGKVIVLVDKPHAAKDDNLFWGFDESPLINE